MATPVKYGLHPRNDAGRSPSGRSTTSIAVQADLPQSYRIPPRIASTLPLEDEYPSFMARTHRYAILALTLAVLILANEKYSVPYGPDSFRRNSIIGLYSAAIVFIIYAALFLRDGLFQRPHVVIWRFIQGLALVYLMFLTYFCFMNVEDARKFFKVWDETLGEELPEKDYASDCWDWEVFVGSLDYYLGAHFIGWFIKMLLIRDWKLCMFMSIFFETMELTFKTWLENFSECWWDSLILDFAGCNALGIYLGYRLCKLFDMKKYRWVIKKDKNAHACGNLEKVAGQFKPVSWLNYNWLLFSSTKRFVAVLWYVIIVNGVDLSNFFLKYVLYLPGNHDILLFRVLLWAAMSAAATREFYEYLSNDQVKTPGASIWLAHLMLGIEWFMVAKFSKGFYTRPLPDYILNIWFSVGILILVTIGILAKRDIERYMAKKNNWQKSKTD
eukprot:CAMPEP_0115017546 /NCGR_PEP_ID=MMETSP0216-20121206/28196_1 /TAXON_ID=223996 /ORGANISM="Protocruzia adherens, Strain Boccale" /LENGTH=442 /DNA_ID=CAMNT_0002388413 /DNA_START=33 /DNA_END=1361 /DNA_ORIENTATION=-